MLEIQTGFPTFAPKLYASKNISNLLYFKTLKIKQVYVVNL